MIAYFPDPYPDELFVSVLMRYHIHSGNIKDAHTAMELYGSKKILPNIEFFGPLTDDLVSVMKTIMPLGEWLEHHTMFPAYARFLPKEKAQDAAEAAIRMDVGSLQYLLFVSQKTRETHFRYCPYCASEDRRRYGEAYWHRRHQIKGVNLCVVHNCRLKASAIPFSKVKGMINNAAEKVIPPEDKTVKEMEDPMEYTAEAEYYYAKYVIRVFNEPVRYDKEVSVNQFLLSRIVTKYSISTRKMFIDRVGFMADLNRFMDEIGLEEENMNRVIRQLHENKSFVMAQICLIASVVGITPEELMEPVLPEKQLFEVFDREAVRMHKEGMSYYGIARRLGTSHTVIRDVCRGGYIHKDKNSINRAGNARYVDWKSEDERFLPKVKTVVAFMEGNEYFEPIKVSVCSVSRALRIPYTRLQKMPDCMEYIMEHHLEKEEFRAKRIAWAARKIDKEGRLLSKQRIYDLVNMNGTAIASAVPSLRKYADEELCQRISELL